MAAGSGRISLWRPLRTGANGDPAPGPGLINPAMLPGLTGWWDAADFSGVLDGAGHSLGGWYQAAAAIMDKSSLSLPLMSYSSGPTSMALTAVPRVAGMKGGVGAIVQGAGLLMPALGPYHGLTHGGARPGSGGDWTWWVRSEEHTSELQSR